MAQMLVATTPTPMIYQALTGELSYEEVIYNHEFTLSILPATPGLAVINIAMANDPGGVLRFQPKLRRMDFDYIVIDTPPSGDFYTLNALLASDLAVIPTQCDYLSMNGVSHTINMINVVRNKTSHKLDIIKCLLTVPDFHNINIVSA